MFVTFLRVVFYEIMWKNINQSDRLKMIIWQMRITCWITKATNTHLEYVVFIVFLHQRRIRLIVILCYNYIVCFMA
jgi:hypothetical protein